MGCGRCARGGRALPADTAQDRPACAIAARPCTTWCAAAAARSGRCRQALGHGAYCIGCCAGIMVALFALGIMSFFWMGVAAVAILVEKTLPGGERFARVLAVALVALGAWLAVSPSSVPKVHQPGQVQMQMGMQP